MAKKQGNLQDVSEIKEVGKLKETDCTRCSGSGEVLHPMHNKPVVCPSCGGSKKMKI